jgi:hypothetical protein
MKNRLFNLSVFLVQLLFIIVVFESSSASSKSVVNYDLSDINHSDKKIQKRQSNDDDYFYDANLDPNEIERLRKQKEQEELDRLKAVTTTTELAPDWFNKKEENPMIKYMENACKEYVKKQFDEMRKSKSKSTLNHSLLSVLTLTGFFSLGFFIGIIIVLVKGRTFSKYSSSSNSKLNKKLSFKNEITAGGDVDKKSYQSVQQNEKV